MRYLLWFPAAVLLTFVVMFALNLVLPARLSLLLTDFQPDRPLLWNHLNFHASIWVAFFFGLFLTLETGQRFRAQAEIARSPLLDKDPHILYERDDRARLYRAAMALPEPS